MSAYWLWPYLAAGFVVYGGRWVVRTLSAGFTAVRAEKSIHRHCNRLARAAGKENPR